MTQFLYGRLSRADVAALTWNARDAIGTEVRVILDSGQVRRTRTSSQARVVCGQCVIWLEGISGCYALERVEPVDFRRVRPGRPCKGRRPVMTRKSKEQQR